MEDKRPAVPHEGVKEPAWAWWLQQRWRSTLFLSDDADVCVKQNARPRPNPIGIDSIGRQNGIGRVVDRK